MDLEQADYRMPATGEAWRKNTNDYPNLFTIIGMAHDDISGAAIVVYTHYEWSLAQLPPIFTCPLADFLALEVSQTWPDTALSAVLLRARG